MRLYTDTHKYKETIEMANNLTGTYEDPVLYHCFWNGKLNEKHYISILSCFYFNVLNKPNRKIILLTNSPFEDNDILRVISQFCEVRYFDFSEELKDTGISDEISKTNDVYQFKSDRIRYVLLYKYGGIWFDLDMFFLRSLDPIFNAFENEICVYTWADSNYPNGAFFMSLKKNSEKMLDFINYLINRNLGYGFQDYFYQKNHLTFDTPLDILVLPCSWFDGGFLYDFPDFIDGNKEFFKSVNGIINIDTFAKGAFCYHWHNRWYNNVEEMSYFDQLTNDLVNKIKNKLSNNDSNS